MLMALALIPAIVLLVVIYLFDRKDKEPFGLLMGLFFAGAATVISAIILELIGEVLLVPFTYFPVLKSILDCFFVIGPAEELGKYLVLWLITWRNKHFNYSFDGIVYAVFVSLGFAALENISYVFQHGFATGILRMFTSVPGHTCFAVLMGFFYSKSKYAKAIGKKGKFRLYHLLSLFVPIVVHALYDALLMVGEASGVDGVVVLCALLWIGFLLALFGTCIALVIVCSKKDFCIVIRNNQTIVYRPKILGDWTCTCGNLNQRNFCSNCGSKRPEGEIWHCPSCGNTSLWIFCGNCGTKNPKLVNYKP